LANKTGGWRRKTGVFGILGGIKLYGLMGIFLAPVVLSVFFALIRIYQEKYLLKG